jgi:F-type H+-transporting ATPase subunit b
MSINWWGLGLQAINVLILVWLLTRVFWRPVAGAIARRKDAVEAMLDAGKAAQAKADAALADVTKARAGIAAERETLLADAKAKADAATTAALADAREKAETMIAAARTAIEREAGAARKDIAAQAFELSVDIAAKAMGRLRTAEVQAAFLAQLVEAIADMTASDRAALVASPSDIRIVSAAEPGDAEKAKIKQALTDALGGPVDLHFVTDHDLIAGLELRSAHFVLSNSWRADLDRIMRELRNAA